MSLSRTLFLYDRKRLARSRMGLLQVASAPVCLSLSCSRSLSIATTSSHIMLYPLVELGTLNLGDTLVIAPTEPTSPHTVYHTESVTERVYPTKGHLWYHSNLERVVRLT